MTISASPASPNIVQRPLPAEWQLSGIPATLQRIYAARGVTRDDELQLTLKSLLPYHAMKGLDAALTLLVDAMQQQQRVLVVGDFDADGATSTAVAIRALRMMGLQQIDYLVPNRFDFGYGLTPELVDVAVQQRPDLILTVDNGIAANAGVAAAQAHGIKVLVTDHHLPGDELPDAEAIVNPNQPGCAFESKAACGCAVVFYLMLALKTRLASIGFFAKQQISEPNLLDLLDLVALATVADVVPLDYNNRILVEQGLRRIRAGRCQPGIRALLEVAGRDPLRVVSTDFGFVVGPRLNAAGRLDDMSMGIECLLTDNPSIAVQIATELDGMNRDRRQIEAGMAQDAERTLKSLTSALDQTTDYPAGVCLYQADWHQGVIGILASRVKEKIYRPVIAFAQADNGELKGSARSIPGLHMRDALDLVFKRQPGLIKKFGGHAMAAGLTLVEDGFDTFRQAFAEVCEELLEPGSLQEQIEVDGELASEDYTLELAETLRWASPWGQGFPEPCFSGEFELVQQRIVGEKHLKLVVQPKGTGLLLDAICFNVDPALWPSPKTAAQLVFQLDVNEFRGNRSVQLLVRKIFIMG
ncbi:single-stranded-DNA-specific exonuclease RecJ [Oceanobacter kriegii]|uniref:single-stranded-DNA-specific exonuclease RecJ n=1 Tax=Oceanobacter kriegii TaxID=64972 RepID=UPI0004044F22|nr:single-stranded-DNA-specific exonuclease RecJ [Oceanobacter kriegii]